MQKCSVEIRETERKLQEALAKANETREVLKREHEKMLADKEEYHNVTNEALSVVEKRKKEVSGELDGIIADLKKIYVLQNSLDNVTILMEEDFKATTEFRHRTNISALNTQQDRETFKEIFTPYYRVRLEVRQTEELKCRDSCSSFDMSRQLYKVNVT